MWSERTDERRVLLLCVLFCSNLLAQPAGWLLRSLRCLPQANGIAQPSWDAQRRPLARRHGTSRPIHPLRGQRVGEASHPGPDTPPPTPRGRSPSATQEQTRRTTSACMSDTPRQDGGGDEIQHIQLKLKAISGRLITLQCRWMKRDAAWKWFAETQGHASPSPRQKYPGHCTS